MIPLLPLLPLISAMQFPPFNVVTFPDPKQEFMIEGDALLKSPMMLDAMAYVNSVVNPDLLAVKNSTYVLYSEVMNAPTDCYYPTGCIRSQDTDDFLADIVYCPNENDWGLTYDDGPSVDYQGGSGAGARTPELRARLGTMGLKATFFVVGSNAWYNKDPNQVKLSYEAGHQIGVHTWTHHPLTSLTNEQIVAEIKYTEALIYQQIGKVPAFFRPPYGDIDDRVRAIIHALGYRCVIWSPDRDTTDADVGEYNLNSSLSDPIVANALGWIKSSQRGFITLEHDLSIFTTDIAMRILAGISSMGSSFVLKPQPVGQCLGLSPDKWYQDGSQTSKQVNPPGPDPNKHNSATKAGLSVALLAVLVPLFL